MSRFPHAGQSGIAKACAPRRPAGFTLVELIVSIALAMFLASVLYPVFTRALRTTFQVTGRAGLQGGLRLVLENVVRDTHRAHAVLAAGTGALDLFLPDWVDAPETAAEANRADAAAMPAFPFSGTMDNRPALADQKLILPGKRISYRRGAADSRVTRSERSGRLLGTVHLDESTHRTSVVTWTFEPSGDEKSSVMASDVRTMALTLVAYRASGCLGRAPADSPWKACGLALSLTGTVLPEADRKGEENSEVVERLVTKAWLSRRLSEAVHGGAAAAFDEQTEY